MTFEDYYGDYYPLLKKTETDLLELIEKYSASDRTGDVENPEAESDIENMNKNPDGNPAEGTQPIIYVKSRIKSPESMTEKLKRNGLAADCDTAMETMHDAVGIRVVCSFIDNVYQVADWLGQQEGYEVVDRKDYIAYPKPNGYRSLHLILRVADRTAEETLCEDGKEANKPNGDGKAANELDGDGKAENGLLVEVQLRTIAIDFWAALEHQMKYKHSIRNERMIREELKRCADEIASVDMSMQTIRDAISRA